MKNPPKKSTTASTTRPRLTDEDYRFSEDRVPDRELVACLLFEFLRESATAQKLTRGLIEKLKSRGLLGLGFVGDDATRFLKQVETLRFGINHPLDMSGFIYCALVPIPKWDFIGLLNNPWQQLRPDVKQTLTQCCTEVTKAAFISDSEIETDQLAEAMREAVIRDMEAGKDAPLTAKAIADVVHKGSYPGRKIFGVVADYARYDDNAIRAALDLVKEEIIRNRPKGIKPQVRKESGLGRPDDWRGKLNSLGRTRLYCHYDGVDALKRGNPTAHQWLVAGLTDKGDRAALKALADAKGRFVRAFHEILPFEKGALPLCVANSRFNR